VYRKKSFSGGLASPHEIKRKRYFGIPSLLRNAKESKKKTQELDLQLGQLSQGGANEEKVKATPHVSEKAKHKRFI